MLQKAPKILFLSAQVGTGHLAAALAMKQAIGEIEPSAECLIVDVYKYASKFFGKVATRGYLQLIKLIPQIYNLFYELVEQDPAISGLKSRFTEATAKNLKPLVKQFSPDAIVSTHAFPSGIASLLKTTLSIPIVGVITDFTIHPFWIQPNTDLYLVPNDRLAHHLIKYGVLENQIKITGIPVDLRFQKKELDKKHAKEKLGLNPELYTILVMGGGIGLGPIPWILRFLRKVKYPIQVVVITGANKGLKKRMERYALKLNRQNGKRNSIQSLKVYGYVNNVYDFMQASDLLISKPGGLTVSEALVAELPFVIAGPLPGPEIRNTQYLLKEKAAVIVKKGENGVRQIDGLLSEPERLEELKEHARRLKKPNAAREAAHAILELVRLNAKQPHQQALPF
jgi:processive 1,2-diacylglycerol beta-glucosyltransferase